MSQAYHISDRCWCCGDLTRADGYCFLCDGPDLMVSPPHVCERSDRLLTDEHGCEPEPIEVPRADG